MSLVSNSSRRFHDSLLCLSLNLRGDSRYQWPPSVFESVGRLLKDWLFLNLFMESTCTWTDAYEVMQNSILKSIVPKIEAVSKELFDELSKSSLMFHPPTSVMYPFYAASSYRPHDLPKSLDDCRRKTDEIPKAEIVEGLEYLSSSTLQMRYPDNIFWTKFVDSVKAGLQLIQDVVEHGCLGRQFPAFFQELGFIQSYLGGTQRSFRSNSFFFHDHVIDAFLKHVGSLVVKMAIQSCRVEFNRADLQTATANASLFFHLHHHIDPANLEFLALNLRFQEALYRIGSRATALDEYDFVRLFCSYLLPWNNKDGLNKELMSLVTLSITNPLANDDSCGEDLHSYSAEVNAALGEAAFLHRAVLLGKITFLCPYELLAKICFLKVELYLKVQLNPGKSSMIFGDNHFFKDHLILKTLRGFTKDLHQQEHREYVKQSLVIAEELESKVESLVLSLRSEKITTSMLKHSLLQLLFKIVFFKVELFLTELLKSCNTCITLVKDQIESLVEDIEYFKRIVTNKLVRNVVDEQVIITEFEAVARGMIIFSYSFLPDDDKFQKMILSLPQVLNKAKIIKAKIGEMKNKFPKLIFPKTYELGFIDFLGRNARKLLIYDPESIAPVKHQIEEVQIHLESLKSFLLKVKDLDVHQTELRDLFNQIIYVAYKLEYVVESIEVDGHLQQSLWLYDLLEDIRLTDQQVSQIQETSSSGKVPNLTQISCKMLPQETKAAVNETVDLDDEQEAIIERLTRGSSQRDVVSIVGMGGSGKTTLAKKLYENTKIMFHFHCRAWCTVSQVYSNRELLLEILSHILQLTGQIQQMSDSDLQLRLRQSLLGRRYLIVMDDLWDIAAWNDLQNSFPDNNNGSRILITSRLQGLVSKIKPNCDPHSIRLLLDDESWTLLKKKVFKDEDCPEELLQVGAEIAHKCQGLPLAVVAIAGVLQKTEKKEHLWKKISESLSSEIISNGETRCMEILEQSYKHLPEYLKACFLYLGVFQEHKNIPVRKLIRFWVAEGFIQESEVKSLEDLAEAYLMELIQRSLVMISKTSADGKVKTCQLHDLLRDLCHSKAKEENFFQLVTKNDRPYSSFHDSDYDMEFEDDDLLAPATFESYRLSFYLKRHHFIDSRPSGKGTRSLIFFASTDLEPKCPYDISFICHNFKLLRVLDLESLNLESSFPAEIGGLVQLRYLAVSGYIKSIPPSIANLWKLETLVVKGLRGKVILPETIWSMVSLRHLHVNNHLAFSIPGLDEKVEGSLLLENLVSLSTPSFRCGEDTESIFRWMPNLRRLRCIFFQSRFSPENCSGFPVLETLTHLESLKIFYRGGGLKLGEFVLPSNLKKLTLSNFCLGLNHIYRIGELPNLRVLKLLSGGFEDQTWDMREEDFRELKFLELDTMDIVEWNASYDHLPSLEQLVLRNCQVLDRIPSEFADISTLQEIEVRWCGHGVEASAEEIGEMTTEIKVHISRL